jgi:H+/gluconate symporter-like permease
MPSQTCLPKDPVYRLIHFSKAGGVFGQCFSKLVMASGWQFHPVYLALAIGCGSEISTWKNDSAFRVGTEMYAMEERETIRHFSFLSVVIGTSGLVAIMILS